MLCTYMKHELRSTDILIVQYNTYTYTHSLLHFINSAETQPSFAVLLNDTSGPTIQAVLNQLEWNEQQINSFEEKLYQTGTQIAFCRSDNQLVSSLLYSMKVFKTQFLHM